MKRDMDLVRYILQEVEAADDVLEIAELTHLSKWSEAMTYYHVDLMIEKGLLDGYVTGDDRSEIRRGRINGLTWDGQDFLDAVRDTRVWGVVGKAVKESVGSTTFGVVKTVSEKVAANLVITHLGM